MKLNFSKMNGLIPVIIQHYKTKQVLMLGFMNREAYEKTINDNYVTFYSRSRQQLWTKGETSDNYLQVKEIRPDCDQDTLLILCEPEGPTCHTGQTSCFGEQETAGFLYQLEGIIEQRIHSTDESSYTKKLMEQGMNTIAQKVGEEAIETVIEAKDNNDELFNNEVADLLYHLLVLLKAKNSSIATIEEVLRQRHK